MTTQTSRGLNWLFDSAMPLWAEHGVDAQTGIFFEALDFTGHDVGLPVVRVRVQARQIYVFASAHAAGWSGPALELAEAGMFALRAGGWRSDRGWAAQIDRTGQGVEWPGDLYDHAFVLFALARLFEVTGAPEYRRYIDETMTFLDATLKDDNGGYREDLGAVCRDDKTLICICLRHFWGFSRLRETVSFLPGPRTFSHCLTVISPIPMARVCMRRSTTHGSAKTRRWSRDMVLNGPICSAGWNSAAGWTDCRKRGVPCLTMPAYTDFQKRGSPLMALTRAGA